MLIKSVALVTKVISNVFSLIPSGTLLLSLRFLVAGQSPGTGDGLFYMKMSS